MDKVTESSKSTRMAEGKSPGISEVGKKKNKSIKISDKGTRKNDEAVIFKE
jgi:hypothetical protein